MKNVLATPPAVMQPRELLELGPGPERLIITKTSPGGSPAQKGPAQPSPANQ